MRRLGVAFSIGNKGPFGLGEYDKNNSLNEDDFWEYDPATDSWTQLGDFPGGARRIAIGFNIGNKGYVGTGFSNQSLDDFWEFDPDSDSWTQLTDFPGGARYYAVGFSINGKGYLGVGYNGTVLNDFWEYNPDFNLWTQKANYGGSGNVEPVGFSINCKGYIGTGSSGNKQFWDYKPSNNSWTKVADFGGGGRRGAAGFSIGNRGYIGTGYSSTYLKDFWEYIPVDDCPPEAHCKNISVTLVNGSASISAEDIDDGSSDESGIQSLVDEPNSFNCTNIGDNTVTLTVTDNYNNTSTCDAVVAVIGQIPDVTITVNPSKTMDPGGEENTIYIGYGEQEVTLTASEGTSYEWSSNPSGLSSNEQSVVVSPDESTTYTTIVTNEYGCEASGSTVINVVDVRCGNNDNNKKVKICHNGHAICVADDAVEAHINHGDYLGVCRDAKEFENEDIEEQIKDWVDEVLSIKLDKNSPNPFESLTEIQYFLSKDAHISLILYDLNGKAVSNLLDRNIRAGWHNLIVNGSGLTPGTYILRLESEIIAVIKTIIKM